MKAIISIFINARPVTHMSVLCVRRSAIRDMMWFMRIMMTPTANVDIEEMNHARYGNKGCRVFKQGGTKLERDFCLRINIPKGKFLEF